MLTLELFAELRRHGAHLETVDGKLHVTAPHGVLTDDVKDQIVAHKEQLIALLTDAVATLDRHGVRLIGKAVGIWRDADLPEVRAALDVVGFANAEVRYLDDPDANVPNRYLEFVPPAIQEIWDRKGLVGTPQQRIEAERKARYINAAFDKLGTSRRRSRVTAATVLHGELPRQKHQA